MRVSILIFHRKKYFLVSRNSKTIKNENNVKILSVVEYDFLNPN
jgi:hypothetical protein